ncbi:unnamed protein product [Camellia sinensis]
MAISIPTPSHQNLILIFKSIVVFFLTLREFLLLKIPIMSRIHPDLNRFQDLFEKVKDNDNQFQNQYRIDNSNSGSDDQVLTVWKRSSMSFQGTDGFTVFDSSSGRLVFRVDNYSRKDRFGCRGGLGLVLMDGSGKALLTLKPQAQILSMQNQWNGYGGEAGGHSGRSLKSRELLFTMRRRSSVTTTTTATKECEAEVFIGGGGGAKSRKSTPDFRVEGSFRRRNCKIIKCSSSGGGGVVVAKIERKRVKNSTMLLSDDVFSLVVKPGFETQLVMAFVIILDRICPNKPFTPLLCSY